MRLILDLLPDSATHHTPQLQCGGLEGRNAAKKVNFFILTLTFFLEKKSFSWFKKCELQDYYSNTSGQCQTNRPDVVKRVKRESHHMVCLIHSLPHSFIHSHNSFISQFSLPTRSCLLSGAWETGSRVLSDQRIPVTPFHASWITSIAKKRNYGQISICVTVSAVHLCSSRCKARPCCDLYMSSNYSRSQTAKSDWYLVDQTWLVLCSKVKCAYGVCD